MSEPSTGPPGESTPSTDPPAFAFDASTRAALQDLIGQSVASALTAQQEAAAQGSAGAGGGPGPNPATGQAAEGAAESGGADTVPNPPQEAAAEGNQDPAAADKDGQGSREEEGYSEEAESDEESEEEDDNFGGRTQPSVFSKRWHERHRSAKISPRFEVPARFRAIYPVGFRPEAVGHFRNFGPGSGASVGRASEAASLYSTAAYTCIVKNSLTEAIGVLAAHAAVSNDLGGPLFAVLGRFSDAQVSIHGVYELVAARYEVLCGRQGASSIANPDLFETYIDPPAAYSSIGRVAYRQQQFQAVRSAAQRAGKKAVSKATPDRQSNIHRGAGRGAGAPSNHNPFIHQAGGGRGGGGRGRGRGRGTVGAKLCHVSASGPALPASGGITRGLDGDRATPWLVRQLRYGLQLPWKSPPRFQRTDGYKLEPKHGRFATEEAQRWLELGYARRATAQERKRVLRLGGVSPGFVTSSAGKPRLVIDYSAVNECLEEQTFRMDQLGDLAAVLGPGDVLFKADISDAYYHLRIRSCDRELLAFQVEGVVYLPLCLNCGLAVAPWFFTKPCGPWWPICAREATASSPI